MEIIKATSLEEIEAIRPAWEKMQIDEPHPIINANIDRYLSVVKTSDDDVQPYVLLFCQQSEPVVMVIGRLEEHKFTCKIGYKVVRNPSVRCLTVVYGGILGQTNPKICATVVYELMQVLRRDEAEVIFFNQLRTDSHMYRLSREKPKFLCRGHFPKAEKHWRTELPASPEVLYGSFSRKRKKEWKRLSRRLEDAAAGPIDVKSYCDESQVDLFVTIASKISAMTYKGALGVGFEDTSQTRTLLIQAAQADRWRAYVLYAGDEPCAFESGIIYGRTYFAEAIGYEPHRRSFSPGTILFVKVLEGLCSNPRVDFFDYGFGNAEYKERLGTESWLEASVYIFAPRFYPVLVNLADSSIRGLSLGLAFLASKLGITRKVKRRWRDRLQDKAGEK